MAASPLQREDAEDEASWITPALAAAIGVEGAATVATVEAELVRRLAVAFEEEDPKLTRALAGNDRSYALPPWAVHSIARPQAVAIPGIRSWDSLLAAEELQVLGAMRLDDRITISSQLADVQERIGGRVGHSLFLILEWRYSQASGADVARIRHTLTHFRQRHTGE